MFEKLITALEPFGLTIVILSGATLTGWINFSNKYVVGIATIGFGILLVMKHITSQLYDNKINLNKKGK